MRKEILLDSLTIACGLAFLYIFVSIAATGGYMATEPNKGILTLEIIVPAIIVLLGVKRLIDDLRKWDGRLKIKCPHCGKQMVESRRHQKPGISTTRDLKSLTDGKPASSASSTSPTPTS